MKLLSLLVVLVSTVIAIAASAEVLTIKGMSCHGCEKQIRAVVCHDGEMSQWFSSCNAKVIDSKHEIGQLDFEMREGQIFDNEKFSKIEKAVAATGRTLEAPVPKH